MGNILFITILLNAVLFSFIFWLLTFLCKYFYQDKYSFYKLNFYECGFKAISVVRLNISTQYFLIALFLIIYDGEFLLLMPVLFTTTTVTPVQFALFFLFFIFIVLTLVVDYIYAALDWSM